SGWAEWGLEGRKRGPYDYVSKPFRPDEVVLVLKKAEERERLFRENRQLKQQLARASQGEETRGPASMTPAGARSAPRAVVDDRARAAHAGDLPHHQEDRRVQDDGAHHRRVGHGQRAGGAR